MRFKLLAAPIPAHGGIIACFTRNHSRISRKSLVCRETGNLASAPKLAVTRTSAVRRPQTSENRMTHTTHARGSGPLVPRPYIRTWAPIRAANRFSYTPGHRGTTNQLMPHARTCVGTILGPWTFRSRTIHRHVHFSREANRFSRDRESTHASRARIEAQQHSARCRMQVPKLGE